MTYENKELKWKAGDRIRVESWYWYCPKGQTCLYRASPVPGLRNSRRWKKCGYKHVRNYHSFLKAIERAKYDEYPIRCAVKETWELVNPYNDKPRSTDGRCWKNYRKTQYK